MARRGKVVRRFSVLGQAYERGNEENYDLAIVTHVDVKGLITAGLSYLIALL